MSRVFKISKRKRRKSSWTKIREKAYDKTFVPKKIKGTKQKILQQKRKTVSTKLVAFELQKIAPGTKVVGKTVPAPNVQK